MLENKFFIAGSDRFNVAQKSTAIVNSFSGYAIEEFNSDATKIAEAVAELRQINDALKTLPLFAARKMIWYKNVDFLSDATIGKSEDVLAWIQAVQRTLENGPEVGFLLTATTIDRRQKVIKWFLENCRAEILDEPKKSGCERHVSEKIKHAGKKITPDAFDLLQRRSNHDLQLMDGELEKLLLYTDGKDRIEIRDVEAIVIDLHRGDFFEAIDVFFENNREKFFHTMERYFLHQEEGRPLLAALQNRVRLLLQLRQFYDGDGLIRVDKNALEDLKLKYQDICSTAPGSIFTQNPWYLGKLLGIAKQYPLDRLVSFQIMLLNGIVELGENYNNQRAVFEKWYFHLQSMGNSLEKAAMGV
jgi:DNA polymerase-3 subunit delta